jgi:hypothetical protein
MKERSTDTSIITYFDKLIQKISNETTIDDTKLETLSNDYLNLEKDPYVQLVKLIDYLREIKPKNSTKRAVLSKVEQTPPNEIPKIEEEPSKLVKSSSKRVLSEADCRAKKNLMRYNEALKKISARIKEFENRELSLDDLDSDRSSYIIESSLKSRFNRINKEYLKYANKFPHLIQDDHDTSNDSLEDVKVNISNLKSSMLAKRRVFMVKTKEFTRYNDLNEKIENYCKNLKEFPDYGDILELIEKSNEELGLGFSPDMCKNEAVSVFKQVGQLVKKKREKYDQECFLSRFESENLLNELETNDPIADDEQLKSVLINNRKEAEEKQIKLVAEFALKQQTDGDQIDDGDDDDDEEEEEEDGDDESIEKEEEEEDTSKTTAFDENQNKVKKMRRSISFADAEEESNKEETTTKINLNEDIKISLMSRLDRQISSSSSTASSTARVLRSKKSNIETSQIDEIIVLD